METQIKPRSLYGISRSFNRLFVPPYEWSQSHLDAVGCRFEDIGTLASKETSEPGNARQSQKLPDRARDPVNAEKIATHIWPDAKAEHLLNILAVEGAPFAWRARAARLIVTHGNDRDYIHLYEAKIPSELLNALRDPKNAPNPAEWPTIWKKDIPFKPYDTFADRLVAELLAPPIPFPRKLPIILNTSPDEDSLENGNSTIASTVEQKEPTTEIPKKDIETQGSEPDQGSAPQTTENFLEGSRKRSCNAEDDKPNKTRREAIEHEVSVS
ncbi:hypothetical protein N7540_006695 [Penicillium herquei]|nr:hypothetical protein N7540_006695 [Penicillium herquei]